MRSCACLVLATLSIGCEPDVVAPPAPKPTVTAQLDLTASPPVIPTPNDLALIGGDGVHLNVPDVPGQSPAQLALNAYLRTLTGFPPSSPLSASFSGPLDPRSVTTQTMSAAGAIVVVDTTTGALVTSLTASLSSDGSTVTVANSARFVSGHKYAVLIFGDDDAAGLRGKSGQLVIASPTFFFLRAPIPLVQRCADPTSAACACSDVADPSCHSAVMGLDDAQARQLEPQRRLVDAALTSLLPKVAPGRSRANVVLFWTFTITTQPVAEFDPVSNALPFPNDVLIDPATGKVALPIAASDPLAPVKMALNQLDGFSVSAPITLPIDAPAGVMLDAATLLPGLTTLLVNLDPTPGAEQPRFSAGESFGQLALLPVLPLVSDQRRYLALVTRDVTAGGAPLVPSPATALLVQPSPLFDGTHTTVNALDDMQAQALETLRLALQPLLALLAGQGVSSERIAALWTFTTQSIARPLAALDAYPTQAALPTDVTLAVYTDFAALPAMLQPLVADVRAVALGSFTTQLVYDPTTRAVTFARAPLPAMPTVPQADVFSVQPPGTTLATVRFWLTLPKTTSDASGAPVVIAQHGVGSWRGDVFPLGDDLARGGSAAIGFDIDFHGARSRCTSDSQCASGAAGSCDVASGACQGGFAVATSNPLACDLAAFSGDTAADCEPASSGSGYIDATNLPGARSGGFQYVSDGAQLIRVLGADGAASLQGRLAAAGLSGVIDARRVSFLGSSIGAIDGSLLLAVDATISGGNVLNVGGGHLFDILSEGSLRVLVDPLLMALGITRGTAEYAQLDATATWLLDPIDPFSVGRLIRRAPATSYLTGATNAPKLAIVQEAGMDTTILPTFEAALSQSLWGAAGVDAAGHAAGADAAGAFASTYFADAVHTTLLTAMPSPSMRAQADGYVISSGATLLPVMP